jgi:SAM-dependent methyltransferase
MLSAQHSVIGVDASAVQLRLAREAAPKASLVQADMTRFHLRPGSVDAVVSFFALGHVPARAHAPLLAEIGTWLRPGGILVTSAPLSPGDDFEDSWLGVPMFFGGIGECATREAILMSGLVIQRAQRLGEDEGGGRIVEFLWLTARKPA